MWTTSMMMGAGGAPEIVYVGSAKAAFSGGALTINKPSGTQSGDLLIAAAYTGNGTITLPSGWTSARSSPGFCVAYKVASGSEPGSYDFGPSSYAGVGIILAYRNAAFDVIGSVEIFGAAPSITLSKAASVLLAAFGGSNSNGAPTGMTAVESANDGSNYINLFGQVAMPAGSTGSRSASSGSVVAAVLIGISPQ